MHFSETQPTACASISIIVPVYNGGKAFEHCLDSLKSLEPPPLEIIVVDDGSTDQSALLAARQGFRVISTSGRSGPANARNLGAKHAQGDLLFFVDADCSVMPDTIQRVKIIVGKNPYLDAFVGSYDDSPTAEGLLSKYKNLLHHYMHQKSGPVGSTFWGACGVIRRDIFEQFGGFNRTYSKASIEDIELGCRLIAAGKKIGMCPELQLTHHKRWRPLNLLYTDIFLRAIPWSRLILRSQKMENSLNTSKAARVRVFLSGLIVALVFGSLFFPSLLWLVAAASVILLSVDWPILSWFYQKKGLWFTLSIVPWHWFSHFYSGVSFAVAASMHAVDSMMGTEAKVVSAVGIPVTESVTETTVSI